MPNIVSLENQKKLCIVKSQILKTQIKKAGMALLSHPGLVLTDHCFKSDKTNRCLLYLGFSANSLR